MASILVCHALHLLNSHTPHTHNEKLYIERIICVANKIELVSTDEEVEEEDKEEDKEKMMTMIVMMMMMMMLTKSGNKGNITTRPHRETAVENVLSFVHSFVEFIHGPV